MNAAQPIEMAEPIRSLAKIIGDDDIEGEVVRLGQGRGLVWTSCN